MQVRTTRPMRAQAGRTSTIAEMDDFGPNHPPPLTILDAALTANFAFWNTPFEVYFSAAEHIHLCAVSFFDTA